MTSNLSLYIKRPETLKLFQDIVGRSANGYVQSVIIAASASQELMQCTEQSVVRAALRAASLGLSCDPAQREAHLVPRNRNAGTKQSPSWVKEASFEIHYLGLYKLAIRTGKYWTINVIPILKNQEVMMGIDGLHFVYEGDMKIDHFPVDRVTAKNIAGVKGWLGYFKTTRGFEKTSHMSVEEIMDHAAKFSKSYQKDLENNTRFSLWSNPDLLPTMQMKTVLRDLLRWADTSGDAGAALSEALKHDSEEIIDAESVDGEYPQGSEWNENGQDGELLVRQNADDAVSELMGEPKPKLMPRPESNEPTITPKFLIDGKIVDNYPHAEGLMNLLGIPSGAPAGAGMERINLYNSWRKIYAKKTAADRELAAAKAIAGEQP